ncbi:flagellin [Rhizobium leguminosarum]|uniref:flagellin N-terminal helical domain-containing protein n=1 Tax=Rhizobium leguminosarum TaxID=384 RepID=UPI00160C75C4|nr:flagellin [Rhizobium leguminosarum]MBB4589680.1 flagellin [Rhizobium leguminosarum]
MTSINTNNAAMAALQTLRGINQGLQETQAHVSSGYRVGKASDNAAYWSIATTMRSDNKALSAVSDALGLGAAKVDTAYSAMDSAIDVVGDIKAKLVAATENGVDKAKVQEEISQLQQQLMSIAQSASFSGENWVAGADGTKNVVSSFVRDGSNAVSVVMTDYILDDSSTGNVLFGMSGGSVETSTGILGTSNGATGSVYAMDITNFTLGQIQSALTNVESALKAMTSAGAQLGSISKLSALQTQQQLAVQSLSIANSSSQTILTLFRG